MQTESFSFGATVVTLLCMEWFSRTSIGALLAYNSTVTGDVRLGAGSRVWISAVLRGDVAPIVIGDRVNIQEGTLVYCDFELANSIEDGVTIGHRVQLAVGLLPTLETRRMSLNRRRTTCSSHHTE
jgi:hypothetical protein